MPEALILPPVGGSYVLLCESLEAGRVTIGRLGELALRPGWYAYVGSAFGPGGLRARVGRHLRPDKRLRWHFDYLRPHLLPRVVWFRAGPPRCEAQWAAALGRLPDAAIPLAGFGASDRPGSSHLFAFGRRPALLHFKSLLGAPCAAVAEHMLE